MFIARKRTPQRHIRENEVVMTMQQRSRLDLSRRSVLIAGVAALANTLPPPIRAEAMGGWSWKLFTYDREIWQRNYWNGREEFDFRFGGGGCMASMRYCPDTYRPLLSPTNRGEETDRVIQGVLWGLNVAGSGPRRERRWNVNQAGDGSGRFSHTVAVERPDTSTTDIWTIADRQWNQAMNAVFAGSDAVPQLTRYTRLNNGTLEIRRC
ncbi:hypothetical protein [Streptomyces sp. NPDC007205]|uniref:hypothetical protein n=1 Tax=Streptomyces sp. NPDC007205 TaxID=3154316 RepID=UPI0033FC67FB